MHSKEDLIYLAGFTDGEGFIGEVKRWKRPSKSFQIRISNTNPVILEWIKEIFGGTIYSLKTKNSKHSPAWQWWIADKKARELYVELKPYLKIKNTL